MVIRVKNNSWLIRVLSKHSRCGGKALPQRWHSSASRVAELCDGNGTVLRPKRENCARGVGKESSQVNFSFFD